MIKVDLVFLLKIRRGFVISRQERDISREAVATLQLKKKIN
jgi:hypothetical protein